MIVPAMLETPKTSIPAVPGVAASAVSAALPLIVLPMTMLLVGVCPGVSAPPH
jgi:hypothetical protein